MANAECVRSDVLVKALETVTASLKKLSPLGRNDPRLVTVFDAILNGPESTFDERERAILEELGIPRELYEAKTNDRPRADEARPSQARPRRRLRSR